jgi:6,7-dimethyl-8-ribityllumazine synthase
MSDVHAQTNPAGLRFAIVASRFNPEITERLLSGAREALRGAAEVTVYHVPGAFEIPLAAKRAAETRRFHGIVAIGCVIRGETAHFEYISHVASTGIGQVALDSGIPVGFGILTVDTDEQAMSRSEPGRENKGFDAAMAAIEMANLLKQF